jgi:hypothetical protein
MKGRPGTTRTKWWGVMDLPRDSHPHADTGLATDDLVSFYHFLILSTVVLSLTSISIIYARINMAN